MKKWLRPREKSQKFGVPRTKNARYAVDQAEFDLFRVSLEWDKLLASINANGYILSPEELRDLWRRFKSGKLTAKGVLEEAKVLDNPPRPKLKIK